MNLVGALALAFVAGACGGNSANVPPGGDGGPIGQEDGPTDCTPALFVTSQQAVTIQAGGTADLTVRYTCNNLIREGVAINFAIQGSAGGSQLSALSAQTNGAGEATVTLTGGTSNATFTVQASAPGATPVAFNITVTTSPVGIIAVNMTYNGTKTLNEFKAYLYQNKNCADLDPFALTTALQVSAPVAVVSTQIKFTGVPTGANYLVGVTAKNGTNMLAWGCSGGNAVTSGQTTTVNITLADLPITYNGTYILDNHFDLSGALPPSVDTVVHVFDELTDDHGITHKNDTSWPANKKYGEDPGAFLLDVIYRQFCGWECQEANPSWDTCTTLNHPYGDLTDLYTQNFQTWDYAQPVTTGMCGVLEFVDPLLEQQLMTWINQYAPTMALAILNIAGDLARAITAMHIKSQLVLSDVRPGRNANFTHQLKTMILDLHHLDNTVHTYEADLAAAGVGTLSYSGSTTVVDDKLQIPTHTFQVKFGKLLQYVYLNYLLPALGYASTADLLSSLINCDSVGTWIEGFCDQYIDDVTFGLVTTCPLSATDFAGYCDQGLGLAGTFIDGNIDKVTSATTEFTLQGSCEPDQINDHRVATSLKNGIWNGSWTEGTSSATFPGTFTGTQQ